MFELFETIRLEKILMLKGKYVFAKSLLSIIIQDSS